MNSLLCIWVPTTSWVQGARGQCGSKLNLAPVTPLTLLPSLPSLPACWTSLPMSNEQLTMYWGLHHLWGQGARGQYGSKLKLAPPHSQITPLTPKSLLILLSLPACWTLLPMSNEQLTMYWGLHHLWGQGARGQYGSKMKLAPLTPRSLLSLQSPCCHSSHSQLAGPCSQCPMNSLLCIGVSITSGGKGLGGNMGARWSWLPSLPDHSSHSQVPAVTPLTPSLLDLALQCPMNSLLCIGVSITSGGKGLGGNMGARWSWPPHSQITPLAPTLLQLTPSSLQLTPNGHVCVGVPTTSGV